MKENTLTSFNPVYLSVLLSTLSLTILTGKSYVLLRSVQELNSSLTVLTGKSYVLLRSVQKLIETEAWLLLTFFLCILNKLTSIHSIITC